MPKRNRSFQKDLREIGKAFKALAHHFERIAPHLGEQAQGFVSDLVTETRSRLKPRLTAATRAAQKLQGEYMGTMRGLSAAKTAMVKKIRAERGVKAAIAAARKMLPSITTLAERPRRKRRFSSQQRAAMKLHGKYLGAIRPLKPRQRAMVKKIRAEKGIRAAIAAAKRMVGE